jgi:hypothetical protein
MTKDEALKLVTDLQAELDATNRQVEILSDALSESRREVDALVALARANEREHYDDLFAQIKSWSKAYPISVFPEPDFKKAHEVLKANGMTLDAISASNMKHVITQVQAMIDAAIRARGNT